MVRVVGGRSLGSLARGAGRRSGGSAGRSTSRSKVTDSEFDGSGRSKLGFQFLLFFHDLDRLPKIAIEFADVVCRFPRRAVERSKFRVVLGFLGHDDDAGC